MEGGTESGVVKGAGASALQQVKEGCQRPDPAVPPPPQPAQQVLQGQAGRAHSQQRLVVALGLRPGSEGKVRAGASGAAALGTGASGQQATGTSEKAGHEAAHSEAVRRAAPAAAKGPGCQDEGPSSAALTPPLDSAPPAQILPPAPAAVAAGGGLSVTASQPHPPQKRSLQHIMAEGGVQSLMQHLGVTSSAKVTSRYASAWQGGHEGKDAQAASLHTPRHVPDSSLGGQYGWSKRARHGFDEESSQLLPSFSVPALGRFSSGSAWDAAEEADGLADGSDPWADGGADMYAARGGQLARQDSDGLPPLIHPDLERAILQHFCDTD
ncbi:hypothetical protein V8C86DRAFT_2613485 [Haematococcus lacustris]